MRRAEFNRLRKMERAKVRPAFRLRYLPVDLPLEMSTDVIGGAVDIIVRAQRLRAQARALMRQDAPLLGVLRSGPPDL